MNHHNVPNYSNLHSQTTTNENHLIYERPVSFQVLINPLDFNPVYGFTGATGGTAQCTKHLNLYGCFDIEVEGITWSGSSLLNGVLGIHINEFNQKYSHTPDILVGMTPTTTYSPYQYKYNGVNLSGKLTITLRDILNPYGGVPFQNSQAIAQMNYVILTLHVKPSRGSLQTTIV